MAVLDRLTTPPGCTCVPQAGRAPLLGKEGNQGWSAQGRPARLGRHGGLPLQDELEAGEVGALAGVLPGPSDLGERRNRHGNFGKVYLAAN